MQIKYIHDFDLFKTIANSVKALQADHVPGAKTHETTKEGNSKMKMRQRLQCPNMIAQTEYALCSTHPPGASSVNYVLKNITSSLQEN